MIRNLSLCLFSLALIAAAADAAPNLIDNIDRPLRYRPEGTDFVIENGPEFFNRPLYGGNTASRVDAGDKPEFTLYLPGRGGNLRLGLKTAAGLKWLHEADHVVTRYRPGAMLYEIRDPLLGAGGVLNLAVLALYQTDGLIVRAAASGVPSGVELIWAYGGVNGQRGQRDGDIGTERVPIGEYFQLKPEFCRSNLFTLGSGTFTLRSPPATIVGLVSTDATLAIGDAAKWSSARGLLSSAGGTQDLPVVVGRVALTDNSPLFLALQRVSDAPTAAEELSTYREVTAERPGLNRGPAPVQLRGAYRTADLPALFAETDEHFRAVREQIAVDTPDPFLNAAVAALCVGVDGVWDEPTGTVQHGAVAWRSRLLGWRGPYAQDALGWHDRARRHFTYWAGRQNTNEIPAKLPPADANSNLSRSEAALHSNGDISNSHYDMNLVYIDAVFRHLLWTGDLEFARKMWPVIQRHLAWEQRLFRREFGPDKLPLYEAYAAIWASDDLQYNGGGAAHASAYNYYHNKMAARLAKLLDEDASPYEREADLIAQGMRKYLWLADRGMFGEFKDYLGLQLVHPSAALWTFYHTLDSEVPTPQEAWQMTRYVDTQIPHLPVRGPGVPTDQPYAVLSMSDWMPYTWSINNVVMGEIVHTALGYWEAGRPDDAFRIAKSALLASMFMGICPGNVGSMDYLDVYRRESQRDFADGGGVTSRAIIEGLFGVKPDALVGELLIRPGFPSSWDHASLRHPDFMFAFKREGIKETFSVESRFAKPMALRMEVTAFRDSIASVTVNDQPASWRLIEDAVGKPRIEIRSAAAPRHNVVITWGGESPATPHSPVVVAQGGAVNPSFRPARFLEVVDPQGALHVITWAKMIASGGAWRNPQTAEDQFEEDTFYGTATGVLGHRTVIAKVQQGQLRWWMPVEFEVRAAEKSRAATDWNTNFPGTTRWEMMDLHTAFNDRVTEIFRPGKYLSPRSPLASLALPSQGIGAWAGHASATAEIDDRGLRAVAGTNDGKFVLPNGVPFATPGPGDAKNIVFTSQWDNYPREAAVPLTGKARHVYLLMAGSSNHMQSRFDNGEVVVTYADGSTERLALHNPITWWPIDQDYFIDDFAFRRPEPIPPRVDLKTGTVRVLDVAMFKGKGDTVRGGAANVLDLPLDPQKDLKSLTVRTLANEVVIGLMAATLAR